MGAADRRKANPRAICPFPRTAQQDLAAHDQLRPVQEVMQRLATRLDDTVAALGSDVMAAALEGYNHIKVAAAAQGLEEHRKELAMRWARTRRVADPQT